MRWQLILFCAASGLQPLACGARPSPARGTAEVVVPAARERSTRIAEKTHAGMQAALGRPAVDAAFEQAFDRIAEDPEVSRAGSELFGRLGKDSEIEQAGKPIIDALGRSEGFVSAVQSFRAAHPNDPDEAFAEHIDRLFDSPAVDRAISNGIDELFERPRVNRALDGVTDQLLKSGEIVSAFGRVFVRTLERSEARLSERVGVPADDPKYEQAVAAHLVDAKRLDRLLIEVARVFGKHPGPRRAVVTILRADEMHAASVIPIRDLLRDGEFRDLAVLAMVAVVAGADAQEIERRAHEALGCAAGEKATVDWLTALGRSPGVVRAFAGALSEVAESEEISRAIEEIYLSKG